MLLKDIPQQKQISVKKTRTTQEAVRFAFLAYIFCPCFHRSIKFSSGENLSRNLAMSLHRLGELPPNRSATFSRKMQNIANGSITTRLKISS